MEAGQEAVGLTAADRQVLAEHRSDFWRDVGKVATGVFIGLVVWTLAMWFVAYAAIDSAFNDEPSISIDDDSFFDE